MPHYGVADGRLLVFGEPPQWSGLIDGRPVIQAVAVTGSTDVIVRVEPPEIDDSCSPYPNLFRVDPAGRIVWRAELPVPEDWTDSYTEFEVVDAELSAFSWSCYGVRLDPSTGAIVSKVFTK